MASLAALGAASTVFVAIGMAVVVLRWVADLLHAPALSPPELVPFSGGHAPAVHAWSRYHVRYYVMALVFLAFDMEMVYMYPWAVVFVREGAIAMAEMGMFITILLLGVLYAWRERALQWA